MLLSKSWNVLLLSTEKVLLPGGTVERDGVGESKVGLNSSKPFCPRDETVPGGSASSSVASLASERSAKSLSKSSKGFCLAKPEVAVLVLSLPQYSEID